NVNKGVEFDIASNPEFLREGSAVDDFMKPDRIVIGVETEKAEQILTELYRPLGVPIIVTDIQSAELIKHASNSFLATKISFINALSIICELTGADIKMVAKGMGMDKRIGHSFLDAGLGFGGFCLDENEKVVIRDKNHNILMLPLKELYEKFKQEEWNPEALSFDMNKKEICFNRITLVSQRKYKGKMIEFKTAMQRKIRVTADHPMIVYRNRELSVCLASDIKKGDFLPLFTDFPSLNKDVTIDLFKILEGVSFQHNIKVRPLKAKIRNLSSEVFSYLRKTKGYKHTTMYDFKRKNYLRFQDYLLLERSGLIKDFKRDQMLLFTTKGTPTYIKGKFILDDNVLGLLGYYISEGHITSEEGMRGERERIIFSFNESEKEYIEEVCRILDYLYIRYTIKNIYKDKVVRITISSRIFSYLIKETFKCGTNSYNAAVPGCVFSLSRKKRMRLLSTLHRGDGSAYFHLSAPTVTYDYGTVSPHLKDDLTVLLQSIGIVPSIKPFRSAKAKTLAYSIRVSGYNQIKALPLFKDKKTQKIIDSRLNDYKRIIKPTGYKRVHDSFCVVKIKEIEASYVNEEVYSLEVENTQTFITSEGIITHNCFPKDLAAFIRISERLGYNFELLKAVEKINRMQKERFIKKIEEVLWNLKGKTIGILGLSFKPNTDDIRFAPSIDIIEGLLKGGAKIKAYDPYAMDKMSKVLPDITYCKDAYEVACASDALVIVTEWSEFKEINLEEIKKLLNNPIIIDGRNIYDIDKMKELGFKYISIGRKTGGVTGASFSDL
ncbi:MAG TPA: hypothetical protein ENG55_02260, partial [Candidatus Omnitrophica bacterium]|nr:hypothetical protein [Candidatus Omnitrophota bacterium]